MLIGLVGKPNCGKSTFFKACTLADVLIANYPFATIKPNHGVGYVRIECIDKEFKVQCMPRTGYCKQGIRFVPVELMDVAGLVKGASEGKGLGNQFLDDLRQADCFIQIVDVSGETDAEGKTTQNYNLVQDVEMLENELDLWYLGILKKVWKTFSRTVQNTKENFVKATAKQFSGLKVSEENVKSVILRLKLNIEKPAEWTDEQLLEFARAIREETKPMIIAANKCDKPLAKENIQKLKQAYPEKMIVPCSADSELALREADKAGLIDYLPGDSVFKILKQLNPKQLEALESIKKNVLREFNSTGVQEILNTAVFKILKYIAVFPAGVHKLADSKGNILPDCFLIPDGSTALDFAYAVHTDLGKNFIRAIDAKTKQILGKDHKLKHRDGLEIVT
ncbi:MAG: redox-regulated ATPase YchF [Candidatus Pacearchaeota archaeon]|nr:redox-regulated ATPase YchF [Candidatus Pacearchaeota archaeon]